MSKQQRHTTYNRLNDDYFPDFDIPESDVLSRAAYNRILKATKDMPDGASRVILVLLSIKERSKPMPFWNNPYESGVTINHRSLSRLSSVEESDLYPILDELRKHGYIEFTGHHFNLPSRSWHRRYNQTRRYQLPASIRRKVIEGSSCVHCGATENLSVDHIVPVAMDGSDDMSNLQCLCRSCNSSKRDRFIG